jgi:hypothetical protein
VVDNENVKSMSNALAELQAMLLSGDLRAVGLIKQKILDLAQHDSEALENLMRSFQDNLTDPKLGNELLQVMAEIRDPAVEQMARELSLAGDRANKLLGLELLDRLDIPNTKTQELVVETLAANDEDPEMLQAAMQALPKMPIASETNARLLSRLEALVQHKDESVRSSSLLLIAQQAKTPQQVRPLIASLDSPAVDVQISAAMALERSAVTSPEIKAALFAHMLDGKALPEVRAMSANALNRFDLSADELNQINQFRQQQNWNAAN